jgi:hypothetical protein
MTVPWGIPLLGAALLLSQPLAIPFPPLGLPLWVHARQAAPLRVAPS